MTEEPDQDPEREARKRPRVSRWAVVRSVGGTIAVLAILLAGIAGLIAVSHPDTPLPDEWNPTVALNVADPVSPLTMWKLRAALGDPERCVAALQTGASASLLAPREDSESCHIRTRVAVGMLGGQTQISPALTETSCASALRLAMWERHGIQPAAQQFFGQTVSTIRQIGSYNCRQIRTTQGGSTRWSTHATADAIDITGFDLNDGQRIRLTQDWGGDDAEAQFLRAVRDSACTWFATTLGPDYNALHADHFHLQARGWGTCR